MMQLPLLEAGQLLLVMGISFAIITLIVSTVRFHRMIQFSEEELKTVDDCNDFFYIQATRYLSKITRSSSGFGLMTVQFRTDASELRPVQEALLHIAQNILREKTDKACLFREDCVGLIIDTEDEKVERVANCITTDLAELMHKVPEINAFRVGAAAFPMHGQNSRLIINTATETMSSVDYENPLPVRTAPPPEDDIIEESETEEPADEEKKEKNSALDPLTGVLKSESIASYMRKYLADIRHPTEARTGCCHLYRDQQNRRHHQSSRRKSRRRSHCGSQPGSSAPHPRQRPDRTLSPRRLPDPRALYPQTGRTDRRPPARGSPERGVPL